MPGKLAEPAHAAICLSVMEQRTYDEGGARESAVSELGPGEKVIKCVCLLILFSSVLYHAASRLVQQGPVQPRPRNDTSRNCSRWTGRGRVRPKGISRVVRALPYCGQYLRYCSRVETGFLRCNARLLGRAHTRIIVNRCLQMQWPRLEIHVDCLCAAGFVATILDQTTEQ